MTITAKYQSKCTRCHGTIQPGERIDWARGKGSRHLQCPEQQEHQHTASCSHSHDDKVAVQEPGVFKTAEGIFTVKMNRRGTGMYAQKLVELRPTQGDRMNEEEAAVRIEFQYDRGAIYRLSEADRMTLDEAKPLMLRYRRCIACGRKLEVKKSVERGVGPVCIKKFRGGEAPKAAAPAPAPAPARRRRPKPTVWTQERLEAEAEFQAELEADGRKDLTGSRW